MDTQMLIGAKFEAGTETEEPILNPRTGATILGLPEASPGQIDTAVAAAQTSDHSRIGPRSHRSRDAAAASSITKTGAHTRFSTGISAPARNDHAGRGSAWPRCAYAAARRAISQLVNTTALATIMKAATTLTATPPHVAPAAIHGFNSTVRLMISRM